RFGLAAVLATFHDILTTIAFIRYLNLEVSLVVVGAVLTMVGYSLNDTIIIFDRVRENLRKFRRQNLYEILNLSINETLPRSVRRPRPGARRPRGHGRAAPPRGGELVRRHRRPPEGAARATRSGGCRRDRTRLPLRPLAPRRAAAGV